MHRKLGARLFQHIRSIRWFLRKSFAMHSLLDGNLEVLRTQCLEGGKRLGQEGHTGNFSPVQVNLAMALCNVMCMCV